MLYPLKFIPVYKDYVWGGRNMEKLGRKLPPGIVAESWEISAHPDGVSLVANGELAGNSLIELVAKFGRALLGTELENKFRGRFPLLIKLIDADRKLSVQVHPNDAYAALHENGESGKTEMWYIIAAKPGAKLVYGLQPGTTRAGFTKAIAADRVEASLNYLEVTPGDVVYLPAGVAHALGEGILLAEIQQNSNATYRVYDYNRLDAKGNKRPLQVEKALEVIDFDNQQPGGRSRGLAVEVASGFSKTFLAADRYLGVELYEINGRIDEKADGAKFATYTFFEGEAVIHYPGGKLNVKAPESCLIPAALGEYKLEGAFQALKAYVPNLERDIIRPLNELGFAKETIGGKINGLAKII